MLNNLILKAGTKIHVSGDSAELWLTDYKVRVDSDGVVEIDSRPLDKKALVTLDEIDGERNVCVSIRKEKINVLEGETT